MVVIAQAEKTVATRRPMEETRKSWLNLLNFMRFLRRGLVKLQAQRKLVKLPRMHCKSPVRGAASVLRRRAEGAHHFRETLCGTAATAVGWALDGVRRVLRIDESAGGDAGGAHLEVGDGAVGAVAEKIGGKDKVVGRWVDTDGDGLNAGGIAADAGQHAIADRVRGHVAIQSRWRRRHRDRRDRRRWRRVDCRPDTGCRLA